MYTNEQKILAVELYIKYDYSPSSVRYELGYPGGRGTLSRWYKEYQAGTLTLDNRPHRSKFTPEQRKVAVDHYLSHGKSVSRTIRALGYPRPTTLCEWLNADVPNEKRKWRCKANGAMVRCSEEEKRQATIAYCAGEMTPSQISKQYGVSPNAVYRWKEKLLAEGSTTVTKPTPNKKPHTETELKTRIEDLQQQLEAMEQQVYRLQLEHDVLEMASKLIKKDQGVSPKELTNREKTIAIDALRLKYPLKELLCVLSISKSSYCYQARAIRQPNKYTTVTQTITECFHKAYDSYGYRRIHATLKQQGIQLSEKVVRRLMSENNLIVKVSTKKKYSSYEGEISPEVENIIKRNFHAEGPNQKWLTDITEFQTRFNKVYLSAIIDCFDGLAVAWSIGVSPNAELANSMLDTAIAGLDTESHPVIHSDRGSHYRWPGWIERMSSARLTRSMSKKGCSPDNAACEGFFGRLKNEMFYGRDWTQTSTGDFINQLDTYMQWYNNKRIKMSLGAMSPMDYRHSLGLT